MKRVIVESPFAGDRETNIKYLKRCLIDCLDRGESPYASHLFFPQFLDDDVPEERMMGIEAGLEWGSVAELTVVYDDLGVTEGMEQGINAAVDAGRLLEFRSLPGFGDE